ncbi:preprotein translocase subunit SecD [Nocardioides sp. Root1257]|uniref:protein translocase subunit SecD n=1 Tax=unclassified Nocardioides TaxID=2615069 RepID=UPI0006F3C839|nr:MULTISPECIES: protein translocase subunit SecD [unclassified Nocardioides]KQW43043.1 preprotein translocase subunit SecD [Nocardioides sp. Root1257]KRC41911.1 preprotein translocase subunit SecD [Nocardioides sp. Root224]
MARNAAAHAGRTLVVFAIGIAVLFGLVAIGGNWKPALGLDLQGGTRITLTANGNPSQENLDEAAAIIDSRVNATGFSEAEVTTQGSQYIVVEVPGDTDNSLLDTVNRQAQLRFRTVACTTAVPGPCASAATPTNPSADPSATSEPGVGVTLPASPSATPKSSDKAKPKGKSTATPKNRPAFTADDKAKKKQQAAAPSTSASPSESASPSGTPTATPSDSQGTVGASAKEALAFITAPPQEAIDAFAAYTCPSTKLPEDNPSTWLVTCGTDDDAATKYLLSPAAIEGTDLKDASAGVPQGQVAWQVNLTLGGDGKNVFADLSDSMAGSEQQFAVVLDGQVISAPTFNGRIPDGNAQITGSFNKTSAESLATSLKFGALPISFDRDGTQVEEIGPSLAGNQLQAGLTAGLLGLILVMGYCLVYYRGLGLVVLASLLTAAAITYGLVLLLGHTAGFTLTLPGIAGLIIGVGVTADSFIIFFERIRDEMREGRSMRVAVETGWVRAKKTRLAANVVSLLSAAVLYLFATGAVKGFGFALGLSTLIDLAILFWFTKPMVTFLARFKFFNGGGELSGLSANTLGIDRVASGGKA